MILPSKRLCDLCKIDIAEGSPFIQLLYPLDRDDLVGLYPSRPDQPPGTIFGDISVMVGQRANTYQFEICLPCGDGILPMLASLKREYIQRFVEDRRRRAEAARS